MRYFHINIDGEVQAHGTAVGVRVDIRLRKTSSVQTPARSSGGICCHLSPVLCF